jgi:hypothetical protein
MKLTPLEAAVIRCLLADSQMKREDTRLDFDAITVSSREFTGAGFLTELARSKELKIFDDGVSLRWGKVGARINASIETGYLLYIDEGYLTAIEGYTYGDEWPTRVTEMEFYALPDPGAGAS